MKKIRILFPLLLIISAISIFAACDFSSDGSTEQSCETHAWSAGTTVREATCHSEGEIFYTCALCPATKSESIPKIDHTYQNEWFLDDESHFHACTDCGGEVKDTAPHTWDNGITVESTCSEKGSITYTCTVCLKRKVQELPLLEHTYSSEWTIDGDWHYHTATCGCLNLQADTELHIWGDETVITPATCVDTGTSSHTCTVCFAVELFTTSATRTHTWDGDGVVTEPTCDTGGYTTHTCTVCGTTRIDSYTKALPCEYNTTVTEPTCTAQGYTTYTCVNCGHSYDTKYTNIIDHTYDTLIIPPSCKAKGYTVYTCAACGDSYNSDYTDSLPHNYAFYSLTEPTCTREGYTTYQCTECRGFHNDDHVNTLPHPYAAVVTEPTCTKEGYTTYTCTVCSDTYKGDYTDKAEHDYELTETIEPTCTTFGEKLYVCACGASYTLSSGKLPHDYESEVIAPTCTQEGYTLYDCSNCEANYKADYTAMIPHNYTDIICTQCGKHEYSIGLSYTLAYGGSYYILNGIGECKDTDLVIPNVHYGIPVREIAESAFKDDTTITSVLFLPGDTLQTIDSYAFFGCTNLSEITLNQVQGIGSYAFSECGITQLDLNDNVKTIGSFAFRDCDKLTSASIGKQVLSIYAGIFAGCAELSQITVDTENEYYYAEGNCLIAKSTGSIVAGCKTSDIPEDDSVTRIGMYAFYGLTTLTKFYIPNNIKFISTYAFAECTSMTHLYFQSSEHWYRTDNLGEAEAKTGGTEYITPNVALWNADYLVEYYFDQYWYQK